jgi:cytochrome b561
MTTPIRNNDLRYGSVAMTFHWTIAALIVTNLLIGFYFANVMDRHDPLLFPIVQLHKSIGLTVLVLSIARLFWRLMNPVPPLPADFSPGLRFLARSSHVLFYVLIIAIPLAGWSIVSSSPRGTPTVFFGLFVWPHIPFLANLPRAAKREYTETFETVHAVLAYSAAVLLVLHVGAALYHHFSRRDEVLRRMVPGTQIGAA